ncbi:MAG: sulfatase-like hydrolase/transferase [Candidatus Hydrogenedentes bacterium]|nr:sulfatase-like hydrolase/transferase [Candidatus Hydrogenedentota bacterium]
MGAYGAGDLSTPNMDALAARGVRFTQFYAPAPVCSPSRAGLLTGRYPVRAGVPGNVSSRAGDAGMPTEQVTIAETFKAAGYATAHIGKWHLGYTPETMPNGQGFDHSFGHMGGCIDNYSHYFYWEGPNRHDLHRNGEEVHYPGRFFPDLMVDEAKEFMATHRDAPFFLYFAFNVPHYPYQGTPEWLQYYRERGVASPRDLYAAFLSTQDACLGRLMAFLDEQGLRENTIVVFQSDHGHSTEERAHGGGGSAGPYRGAKFSMFEGGIRIPAIISWPGRLPEGEVRAQVGHGCDWLPTLAELCGVPLVNEDIDGKSLAGMIRGGSESPHTVLHWQTGLGENAPWAVREGDWKLLGHPQDTSLGNVKLPELPAHFLVNVKEDPAEQNNLADLNPDKVQHLEALHAKWLHSAGAN